MKQENKLVLPTGFTWDDLDPKFSKGSRYAITIPERDGSDFEHIEVTVVEKPASKESTVLVDMDGEILRYPKELLRIVIDDDTRSAIQDAQKRQNRLDSRSKVTRFVDRLNGLKRDS